MSCFRMRPELYSIQNSVFGTKVGKTQGVRPPPQKDHLALRGVGPPDRRTHQLEIMSFFGGVGGKKRNVRVQNVLCVSLGFRV